eukprot:7657001-Alexandrium_andersonii.AAC.1
MGSAESGMCWAAAPGRGATSARGPALAASSADSGPPAEEKPHRRGPHHPDQVRGRWVAKPKDHSAQGTN